MVFLNFPAICPKGHACSKTVTINLDKGESWRLQKHLRRKQRMVSPKRLWWEHRNSAPTVPGVYLCSQHRHTDAQPRVPALTASAPPGKFTHLVLEATPARQIPGCLDCNTAMLLSSELNLGTSLGFQFSFISEVDGLRRTCTKPWSPSHGSCSMEVILLTKLFHKSNKLWFRWALLTAAVFSSRVIGKRVIHPCDKLFNDSILILQPLWYTEETHSQKAFT